MKKILFFALACCLGSGLLAQETVSFTDQGDLLGLGGGSSHGCAVDMNSDDLDDVVRITSSGIYIDYQRSNGTFEQEFYPVDLGNMPSWSIAAGDIDDNGYRDLLFGGSSLVSFVKASADGTSFEEQVIDDYIFSQRSTFYDIDRDGDLDAFVCHDVDLSHPYRNDGLGNMTEDQSLIETVNLPGNYAAIWVDYNHDSYTDLYITKCRGGASPGDPSRTNGLYRNNGDGTFTEVGAEANMDDNAQSWATVFEDFDNDGDFDAFIVNHDFQNRFMRNNGDGTFTDIIATTGINAFDLGSWENASGDFNNDGFVDILSELSNELYLNNGDMTFTGQDLPFDEGGIGDLNNDGFLDVTYGSTLMINDGNENNWIKIIPKGVISNRDGIGARVTIYGEWGQQVREVRSGQSFSPMSAIYAHFGLGQAETVDSMVIRWPSGVVNKIDNPTVNTTHAIQEVSCILADETIGVLGELALCEGESVQLIAPAGYDDMIWSIGGANPTIEVDQPGTYGLTLIAEDGCVALATPVTVTRLEDTLPTIETEDELTFCQGDAITLTTASTANPSWSNGQEGSTITVTEAGTYFVETDALCSEGSMTSATLEVMTYDAEEPLAENVEFLPGDAAFLTATGAGTINWYASATAEEPLATGPTYITEPLTEGRTFYVEAVQQFAGETGVGAKLTIDGGGGIPSIGAYNYFDAYTDFIILQVDVFVPEDQPEGPRTVQLYDNNDQELASIIVDMVHGLQTIDLNFEVPEGEQYSLRCPENNIFRNNSGVQYPYPIGDDLGSVTDSYYGGQYYYYFYNWQVETTPVFCASERVPVEASVLVNVNEIDAVSRLELFPNPASTTVQIRLELTERVALDLRLVNALGQIVRTERWGDLPVGTHTQQLDVSRLPAGVYELQLQRGERVATEKIVVE
ncbi:MAG: FG-GAP-like repeat-containing protein [Bacteroidota bacterium]